MKTKVLFLVSAGNYFNNTFLYHFSYKIELPNESPMQMFEIGGRPPDKKRNENYFSYFSTKTYVVGTQKKRLNETSRSLFKIKMWNLMVSKKKKSIICVRGG